MQDKKMHLPGIDPGSHPWQQCILPLGHWCSLNLPNGALKRALSAQPATASAEPESEAHCARARSIAAAAYNSRKRTDAATRAGAVSRGPNALPAQRACRGCCGKFLGLACCQRSCADDFGARQRAVTPSGLEPTPLRYGALSRRLRPLGQIVLDTSMRSRLAPCAASHRGIGAFASRVWHSGLPQCIFCS